jgi:hypothetical protein
VVEREVEAYCLACNRFAYLRAIELIENLGNIAVIDVAQHLRCSQCGSRWCETRPDYAVRAFRDGRPVM